MNERILDGRYRADELLGSGGMGTVWRGRDLRLDRPVAIKELTGPGLADPTAVQRFGREARTVARLTHPNIVAVYDVGTGDETPYLVMELVEGRSLASIVARGPLPIGTAVSIATQVCDGLAAAHAAGVVHRDIKPANLIVTPTGLVKICDFGLARLEQADGEADLTGSAVALGSAKYMAPEQVTGDPVDGRTDLYGLGCTLYAMLAGTPPFQGENAIGIVHRQLTERPAPVRSRRPDVPAELDRLVADLLAKSPAERPADAATVRARLSGVPAAGGSTTLAQPPAPARMSAPTTALPRPAAGAAPWIGTATPAPPAPALEETRSAPAAYPARVAARPGRGRLVLGGVALIVLGVGLAALAPGVRDRVLNLPGGTATPSVGATAGSGGSPAIAVPAPTGAPATPPAGTWSVPPATDAAASAGPTDPRLVDPIAHMRATIAWDVASRLLDRKVGQDLLKRVDDLEQERADGDPKDIKKEVGDLREEIDDLYRDGKLASSTRRVLLADLDRASADLP
ncbi:protein kinase [Plantactinospora sp. KBS50]|uniref:protein kinase domain-containing protein n=1 Tax=Plantactinospora sp. KBS50 TaxID=2024580 RepID=UPI0012FE3560|nr:protein kinase [Plantactinospora sp. KBS50]